MAYDQFPIPIDTQDWGQETGPGGEKNPRRALSCTTTFIRGVVAKSVRD